MNTKTNISLYAVELTPFSFHIGIEARISRKKVRLIIDTGASQTVISRQLVNDLHLETTVPEVNNITVGIGQDTLNPEFTLLKSITIEKIKIKDIPCIVLPMDHINKTYASIGQKNIDGIVGNDLLFALKAKIDMFKLRMSVESEKNVLNFGRHMEKQYHISLPK